METVGDLAALGLELRPLAGGQGRRTSSATPALGPEGLLLLRYLVERRRTHSWPQYRHIEDNPRGRGAEPGGPWTSRAVSLAILHHAR